MGDASCQRPSGTQTYGEATIKIVTGHLSRGKSLLEDIVSKQMLSQDVAHISAAHNLRATKGRRVLPNFRGSGISVLLCVQRLRAHSNQWDMSIAATQTYLMVVMRLEWDNWWETLHTVSCHRAWWNLFVVAIGCYCDLYQLILSLPENDESELWGFLRLEKRAVPGTPVQHFRSEETKIRDWVIFILKHRIDSDFQALSCRASLPFPLLAQMGSP